MTHVDCDERVLIVAPAGRDGELLKNALGRSGIVAGVCSNVAELTTEISAGVGTVVLTEEAIGAGGIAELQNVIAAQPPWSDIPVLILITSRTPAEERLASATAELLGNVTMLHRPMSSVTFLSSVRAALRMRRRQYEIRGYIQQLEANSRAKDEFLAMLGHELRNPLASVRSAVATASLDESRRDRALEIAQRQTEQLGRLIDDLLDVARITQGHVKLRKERIYLAQILERSIENTRALIEARGIRLTSSIPAEPMQMEADPTRLEQVFINILSNAAKYTEPGGEISVTVARDRNDVIVRVRDTGIGIAPDVLPRIWGLFTQSERSLDRSDGGLGIGLTVARRLVELHGGHIEARSEGVGKGAEFTVRLGLLSPAVDAPGAKKQEAVPPSRHGRVLIVEDNTDAAESLAMLLEVLGHHVRIVHDGLDAMDAAKANLPDVMLVDIGVPGIDGYEVARRIRRDPALKSIVLVALTGYGQEADKQQAFESGFDYHLVKPVDLDALKTLVGRVRATGDKSTSVH